MTIAICVNCGGCKQGAWTACRSCGFRPANELDMAHSLGLTDHYHDKAKLERISRDMRENEVRPQFHPEDEAQLLAAVRSSDTARILQQPGLQEAGSGHDEIESFIRSEIFESLCLFVADGDLEIGVDHFKVARHQRSPLRRRLPYLNQKKVVRQALDFAQASVANWDALWQIGAISLRRPGQPENSLSGPEADWTALVEKIGLDDDESERREVAFASLIESVEMAEIQVIISLPGELSDKTSHLRRSIDGFSDESLAARCQAYALSSLDRWERLWALGALKLRRRAYLSEPQTAEGWSRVEVSGPQGDWAGSVENWFWS